MRTAWLVVMLLPAFGAAPKEAPVDKRLADFEGVARYQAPEGWEAEDASPQPDASLRLSREPDLIKIRLLGGKDSRYAAPASFLKGFEATTMGKPPQRVRKATVAGRKVWIYRHGYPLGASSPDAMDPRPPALASEEFCILPAGKKFLVLSWAHESPVPDPESAGAKAWESFLASFTFAEK